MKHTIKTNTKTAASAVKVAPGDYTKFAEAVLLGQVGLTVINSDVRAWLDTQEAAGVAVGELADKWRLPENAALAEEMQYVARLIYVIDELERKVGSLTNDHETLLTKVQAGGVEKLVELAADNTEALVETTARLRTYKRFKDGLDGRMSAGQPPAEIYAAMSTYTYSELARTASNLRGRTTSWKDIAHTNAVLSALGDVASLFLDVAKI